MELDFTDHYSLGTFDVKLDCQPDFIKQERQEDYADLADHIKTEIDEKVDVIQPVEDFPQCMDVKREFKHDIDSDSCSEGVEERTSDQDCQPMGNSSGVRSESVASGSDAHDAGHQHNTRSRKSRGQSACTSAGDLMTVLDTDDSEEESPSYSRKLKGTIGARRRDKLTCRVCEDTFGTIAAIEQHFRKCHKGSKPHVCHICGNSYKTTSGFGTHMHMHSGKRNHQCSVCKKLFLTNYALKKHLVIHADNRPRPYECNLCGNTFTVPYDLNKHYRIHTEDRQYKCKICEKTFIQKGDLVKHNRTHTKDKPYKCDTCDQRFARKHVLANHILVHTGEKPYKCEYCDKTYSRRDVLAIHEKTHKGLYDYECQECGKHFVTKGILVQHLTITSCGGFYKCTCGECGQGFAYPWMLKKHCAETHSIENQDTAA